MWNTRSGDSVTLVLKSLEGAHLGVTVNARCIIPQDPLRDSLEAYDIIGSNLINILGLRYQAEHATKEMIIAPFGRFLCFLAYLRNGRVTETYRTSSLCRNQGFTMEMETK